MLVQSWHRSTPEATQNTAASCVAACIEAAVFDLYGDMPGIWSVQAYLIKDLGLYSRGAHFGSAISAVRRRWPAVNCRELSGSLMTMWRAG